MRTASSASRTFGAGASASEYTATEWTPSSWHARTTRRAISPRFATRIFFSIRSERDVPVLLRRVLGPLSAQRLERRDEAGARVPRVDDVVHVSASGRHIRVRELLGVLRHARVRRLGGILALRDL